MVSTHVCAPRLRRALSCGIARTPASPYTDPTTPQLLCIPCSRSHVRDMCTTRCLVHMILWQAEQCISNHVQPWCHGTLPHPPGAPPALCGLDCSHCPRHHCFVMWQAGIAQHGAHCFTPPCRVAQILNPATKCTAGVPHTSAMKALRRTVCVLHCSDMHKHSRTPPHPHACKVPIAKRNMCRVSHL